MRFHSQARHHFVFRFFQLQLAGLVKRPPVFRQITRAIPFGRLSRHAPTQRAKQNNEHSEMRERVLPSLVAMRVAAGVIEMQMRVDDDRDLFGVQLRCLHSSVSASGRSRLMPYIDCLLRLTTSRRCRFRSVSFSDRFDEHAVHVHPDAVLIVRRTHLRPEIARDHTKHRPAVEAKFGVGNDLDAVIAKLALRLLTLAART